jgi:divalent metal cation (Fe/Co/Zn/Cd) transporter
VARSRPCRLGGRPADEDRPYGHRRAENLGALGEAAILAGGGVFIVTEAIGQHAEAPRSVSWRAALAGN